MTNKFGKITQRLLQIIPLIVGVASLILTFVVFKENDGLDMQIRDREKLIADIQLRDSLYSSQSKKNASVVEKYVSDCELTIDGKKVSMDDLVKLLNRTYQENNKFQNEVFRLTDSIFQLKRINSIESQKNSILRLYLDSLALYKSLYGFAQRDYGIGYSIDNKNEKRFFRKVFSRADSALLIFPYYRDKLKKDSSGRWGIELPTVIQDPK